MAQVDINQLEAFKTALDSVKDVLIVAHASPDGDAIGSLTAMRSFLVASGKEVTSYVPDAFPSFLHWMDGADDILIYEEDPKRGNAEIEKASLIICLDFNRMSRTGPMAQMMSKAQASKVLIDHHLHPSGDFKISFSDTSRSSTCELLFAIIESMGHVQDMSTSFASSIYTGMVTDTGSFKYNTSPETHRIAGALLSKGISPNEIQGRVFDTNTKERLALLGYALSEKLVHMPEHDASYMSLTAEELKRFNYRRGDTEGLVNYGLSIQDTRFTALASEKDGVVKISFRSKGDLDVNVIARDNFGGGGHKNAAGARSERGLDEVLEVIRSIIETIPHEV